MISNSTYSPIIQELIEELGQSGLHNLSDLMSRLFNELMKAEREQALQAVPYERTDSCKGYANGFKNKTVQTRFGKMELNIPKARGLVFYPKIYQNTLLSLPPASPELNPTEQIWQTLRDMYLSNRCYEDYDDIVRTCCDV